MSRKRRSYDGILDGGVPVAAPAEDQNKGQSVSQRAASGLVEFEPVEKLQIKSVSPHHCVAWHMHDRAGLWFNETDCADLIEDIRENGQRKPGVVRLAKAGSEFKYEVLEGMRRRYACSVLDQPFKVMVVDVNDQEAAAMMDAENGKRKDISPFERALSYRRLLDENIFESSNQLAKAMSASQGAMSNYLNASKLFDYDFLKSLFSKADLRQIPIKPAIKLVKLLESNEKAVQFANAHCMGLFEKHPTWTAADFIKDIQLFTQERISSAVKIGPLTKTFKSSNGLDAVSVKRKGDKITMSVIAPKDGITKRELKKIIGQAFDEFS